MDFIPERTMDRSAKHGEAMENEMVERVARTLLADADWTGDSTGEPDEPSGWDALGPDWQARYRSMARAAIEAMRELPANPDMPEKPPWDFYVCASFDEFGGAVVTRDNWSAMIDAALQKTPQTADADPG